MDFFAEFFGALKNDISAAFGERIPLGDNPITTLNIVIWSLYIGFVLGIIITLYNRFVLGGMIQKLVERKAHTEGGALTMSEIGCATPFLKLALRNGGTFRRIVKMVGDTDEARSKTDFKSARFYIPEDNVHRAEVIYGRNEASFASVLLALLALLVVAFLSFKIVPNLIGMLSNFLDSVAPESNIL